MKKLLIYASVVGVAAGIAYWVNKKEKVNKEVTTSSERNTVEFCPKSQEGKKPQEINVCDKINQAKSECAQDVYERHTVAGEITKDAYHNIMENFVEDYSAEDVEVPKEKAIIDSEDVTVIQELDSISGELDDLLK